MKKLIIFLLVCSLVAPMFAGCLGSNQPENPTNDTKRITLKVVSPFGPDDGRNKAYLKATSSWEKQTGITVANSYFVASEASRRKVLTDFELGNEPDVLYFFTGSDAEPLAKANKVVPLQEIKNEYPNYAYNMDATKIPVSEHNAQSYAVPTIGYWQALYANTKVLELAGVLPPDKTTSWAEFLIMCEKVRQAGLVPIAISLMETPHYLFDFALRNNSTEASRGVPTEKNSPEFAAWVAALEDMKSLYDQGFFPHNTFAGTNQEAFQSLVNQDAAFMFEDSQRMPLLAVQEDSNITVTYVPGKVEGQNQDVIGGISMGYYISRKAWDHPKKRQAAVDFVMEMTSDDIVSSFSGGIVHTALQNEDLILVENSDISRDAASMLIDAKNMLPAMQYQMKQNAREKFMSKTLVAAILGEISTSKAVEIFMEDMGGGLQQSG